MTFFSALSLISLLLAGLSLFRITDYLRRHPQRMRIMNLVWPLTALWGSVGALWAFFSFGREKSAMGMETGDPQRTDKETDPTDRPDMKMPGMKMDGMPARSFGQRTALSTFHCGAGCTLADLLGETAGTAGLTALGLTGIGWQWGLDYLLALAIGAFFQYAAIRPSLPRLPAGSVFFRALKIDFLSLSSWQIGMYLFTALAFFGFGNGPLPHDTLRFWFIMQLAMAAGFACSYPVNALLIRKGIKPAM